MLMHVVMFTFKTPFSWSSPQAIDAEQTTKNHPTHINEIKGWICGRNITHRKIASDFLVIGMFENEESMQTYLIHPDHQKGVKKWQEISDWTVADINLENNSTFHIGLLDNLTYPKIRTIK